MSFAMIFPGQGSQSVGMLSALAVDSVVVTDTFTEASDALGYDLWQLVQQGPESDLNQTDKTQPAMLAAGIATWRAWQQATDARPLLMAGHSLGEYTALVASEAMEFTTAIKLVEKRGQLMQAAVPEGQGAMAAILGLTDEEVIKVCDEAAEGDVVQAVNFNAPGQVVVAGSAAAVARATEQAKAAGAKRALLLPVSVPSHCSLMQSAADELMATLVSIDMVTPKVEVIHNVDVSSHADAGEIRDVLARQLYNPVRWVETIQKISQGNISNVVECGPGKVLAGLNKRIDRSMTALPVFDSASLATAIEAISA